MNICQRCSDLGQCCRYIELPLLRSLSRDEVRWVNLHEGVSIKDGSYDGYPCHVVRFEVACSALTPSGLCSLFGTSDRPEMCVTWPDDLAQLPKGCAYAERLALV